MFKKACPESLRRVRPARPQPFPAFVAHFGEVGLARGAYSSYVSTAKRRPCLCEARERRWLVSHSLGEGWRLFSTFPKVERLQGPVRFAPAPLAITIIQWTDMEWDQEIRSVCPNCGFVGLPKRSMLRDVVLTVTSIGRISPDHSRTTGRCPSCKKSQLVPLKPPFGETLDSLFTEPRRFVRPSS